MKNFYIAIAMIAVTTGCANSTQNDDNWSEYRENQRNGYSKYVRYKLEDGRHVDCVVKTDGYGGGVSCDWENAK